MRSGSGDDSLGVERRSRAPAKLNLCLFLGPRRSDGLHEIRSIFQPLSLADRILVQDAPRDEVLCPGIDGPELGARALDALRKRGWAADPVRIEIEKQIPVAAGLGGGSADAAAVLRLARGELDGVEEIAAELGADVPSQLVSGPALISGAGERVEPLGPTRELGVLLLPSAVGLATAEVYAEADRLGLARDATELDALEARLRTAASGGLDPFDYPDLMVNDLQPAAISLRPEIEEALRALRDKGSPVVALTGSGPTVFALFEDRASCERAAASFSGRDAPPIVTSLEGFEGAQERAPT